MSRAPDSWRPPKDISPANPASVSPRSVRRVESHSAGGAGQCQHHSPGGHLRPGQCDTVVQGIASDRGSGLRVPPDHAMDKHDRHAGLRAGNHPQGLFRRATQTSGSDLSDSARGCRGNAGADLIISVGFSIQQFDPKKINPNDDKTIIHINTFVEDTDAHYSTALNIMGDIDQTLEALIDRLRVKGIRFDESHPMIHGITRQRIPRVRRRRFLPDEAAAHRARHPRRTH